MKTWCRETPRNLRIFLPGRSSDLKPATGEGSEAKPLVDALVHSEELGMVSKRPPTKYESANFKGSEGAK